MATSKNCLSTPFLRCARILILEILQVFLRIIILARLELELRSEFLEIPLYVGAIMASDIIVKI